jgi:diguanylate cyclase (GGDEF)-like protein/PAS domain S-box-containing protein
MSIDVSATPAVPETRIDSGTPSRPFTLAERHALLDRLLAEYPDAGIAAADGNGLFVPIPPSLPVEGRAVITGHQTALELVDPDDIGEVIDAWKTATGYGAGVVHARPIGRPDGRVSFYFVDARDRYGVFVTVAVTADGSALSALRGAGDLLRPRLTVVRKSRVAEFVDVDAAFTRLLGHGRAEILGRRNLTLVHPDDQPRAIANWIDLLGQPGATRQVRLRHQHADGSWVWFEVTNHNRLDDPVEECVVAEMIDISDEMAAQEELRASQQLLTRLTDALPVGVVQVDRRRRIVYANARAGQILGSRNASTLAGLFAGVATEDVTLLDEACASVLEHGADGEVEVGVVHPRRNLVRCRVALRPLSNGDEVTGAIACIDDITEPARLRAQLEIRATYDALTGCLNRASLLAELEQALTDARTEGTGTAAVFVDLDGFKAVNDTRGHTAGDQLLQEIAGELSRAARRGDVVGRVGGDEFIVVGRGVATAEQAEHIAQRLADALFAAVAPQPGHEAAASIGVAWTPAGGRETADQLIARADRAMYVAKRAADGRPVLA